MASEHAPDWILQEALKAQDTADEEYIKMYPSRATRAPKQEAVADDTLKVAFIHCQDVGEALLTGLLTSSRRAEPPVEGSSPRPNLELHVCSRKAKPGEVERELREVKDAKIPIYRHDIAGDCFETLKAAQVLILDGRMDDLSTVSDMLIDPKGERLALENKLIINMSEEASSQRLTQLLNCTHEITQIKAFATFEVNLGDGLTYVEQLSEPLSEEHESWMNHIFSSVGKIAFVPSAAFDTCVSVSRNGPALVMVMIEAMASPMISAGVPPPQAYIAAAHVFRESADMILIGRQHPALMRDRIVATDFGAQAGVEALDEGSLRSTIRNAIHRMGEKKASDAQGAARRF